MDMQKEIDRLNMNDLKHGMAVLLAKYLGINKVMEKIDSIVACNFIYALGWDWDEDSLSWINRSDIN